MFKSQSNASVIKWNGTDGRVCGSWRAAVRWPGLLRDVVRA